MRPLLAKPAGPRLTFLNTPSALAGAMGKAGVKRGNAALKEEEDVAPIELADDADLLDLLHEPMGWEQFLKQNWQSQQPVVFRSTPVRKALFSTYLSKVDQLVELVKENPQMEYDADISLDPTPEDAESEVVDPKQLGRVMTKESGAAQVHQPQRFHDGLWRLVARMEAALACLVGCTAQVFTAGSAAEQGERHVFHTETWVCQTRGSRQWKQCQASEDEAKDQPALMDVTLQAGDVLYIPRGSVFEDEGSEACAFLVLTSHHEWTWGHLAEHMLHAGNSTREIAEPVRLPASLTASLPPGFLHNLGLTASIAPAAGASEGGSTEEDVYSGHEKQAARTLAQGLRALADALEQSPDDLLPLALDSLAEDYVRRRLPPHPTQLGPEGPEPTLDDSLVVRGSGLFMLMPVDGPADPQSPEGFVVVTTPLFNNRLTHMMSDDEEDESEDEDGHMHSGDLSGSEDEEEEEGKEGKGKACGHGHHHHHHHHHSEKEEKAADKGGKKAAAGAPKESDCCVTNTCAATCDAKKKREAADPSSEDLGSEDDHDHLGSDSDDGSDDDDDDDKEPLPGPVVPAAYAVVIARVLAATSAPGVTLREMVELVPHRDEDEALNLAHMLWTEGFATTIKGGKPAPPKEQAPKKEAAAAAAKKEAADKPAEKKQKKDKKKA